MVKNKDDRQDDIKNAIDIHCACVERRRLHFFNVIHNTTLRNRLSVVEQCLFGEITSIILNLQDFYKKILFKINDIETTALYCLGYNTIKTERKQFTKNDLNILHRNKDILRAMQRSDRVDLYQISASSKKKAREIMKSV